MNKKILMSILPLVLGLILVNAGLLVYYGLIQTTIDVTQPISFLVDGNDVTGQSVTDTITCDSGETCSSELIYKIANDGDSARTVKLDSTGNLGAIDVSYIGELTLTEKTVDFGNEVWEIPQDANTVTIKYTIVGDEFSAEVPNSLFGYVLIYYKDNSDRFNNPAQAILVDDVAGNLPYETDGNVDEYDYCETGEYSTCHGAKIWYVPSSAIDENGNIDWSKASDFFFETELIQFNSEGEIIVYPDSSIEFTPEYTVDSMAESGEYHITTTIN